VGGVGIARTGLVGLEGMVEAVATAQGVVAVLATHLASGTRATTFAPVPATSVAASSIAATIAAAAVSSLSSTSVATTLATTLATITMAVDSVARSVDLPDGRLLLKAKLCTQKIGVKIVERHQVVAGGDGGDEGIVFRTSPTRI
jgi:hypothetical protein